MTYRIWLARNARAHRAYARARPRASVAFKNIIFLSYDNTQTQPKQHKKTVAQGPAGPLGNSFFVLIVEKCDYLPAPLKKIPTIFAFFHLLSFFNTF